MYFFFRYLLINKHHKKFDTHSVNAKNLNLTKHLLSTCPTVYVNKRLSCPTYGRVLAKGRNYALKLAFFYF